MWSIVTDSICDAHLVRIPPQGLTSNCFFVYPGRVLKTAHRDVLPGYARCRVTAAAVTLGYRVEPGPVTLAEATLWKQVFLTSAVCLVQPVRSLVDNTTSGSRVVWHSEDVEKSEDASAWQEIYNRIQEQENL